jgi:hypothetical protein
LRKLTIVIISKYKNKMFKLFSQQVHIILFQN